MKTPQIFDRIVFIQRILTFVLSPDAKAGEIKIPNVPSHHPDRAVADKIIATVALVLQLRTVSKAFDETICEYLPFLWRFLATRFRKRISDQKDPCTLTYMAILRGLSLSSDTKTSLDLDIKDDSHERREALWRLLLHRAARHGGFDLTGTITMHNQVRGITHVPLLVACSFGNVPRVVDLLEAEPTVYSDLIRGGSDAWLRHFNNRRMPLHEACGGAEFFRVVHCPAIAKMKETIAQIDRWLGDGNKSDSEKSNLAEKRANLMQRIDSVWESGTKMRSSLVDVARLLIERCNHPVDAVANDVRVGFELQRERLDERKPKVGDVPQIESSCKLTPLAIACQHAHPALVRYLLSVGTLAERARRQLVCLDSGTSKTADGTFPIHFAASGGKPSTADTIETIKLLLEHGKNGGGGNEPDLINKLAFPGITPLSLAVLQQNLELVTWLLDNGATVATPPDPDKNPKGWQPLSVACSLPPTDVNSKIVELLISRGANSSNTPPIQPATNLGAVFLATQQAVTCLVVHRKTHLQLQHQPSPEEQADQAKKISNALRILSLLLSNSSSSSSSSPSPLFSPDTATKPDGTSPLHYVCSFLHDSDRAMSGPVIPEEAALPIVELLLDKGGADPTGCSTIGDYFTPFLHTAVYSGFRKVAAALMNCRACKQLDSLRKRVVNAQNGGNGETALHRIVRERVTYQHKLQDFVDGFRWFVEVAQVDLNIADFAGRSPLAMAFDSIDTEKSQRIIELILLEYGSKGRNLLKLRDDPQESYNLLRLAMRSRVQPKYPGYPLELLAENANCNSAGPNNSTDEPPLVLALERQTVPPLVAVQALVENAIALNINCLWRDDTPLMRVCRSWSFNEEVARYLLSLPQVDVGCVKEVGEGRETVISILAARPQRIELLKLALNHKSVTAAVVNVVLDDITKDTARSAAERNGHDDVAQLLASFS